MLVDRGVAVELENIRKTYPDGCRALDGLNLSVAPGEWLVLVGPSGCGKTTTLRIIAGLESPSEGTVRLGDRVVNQTPPWRRDVAMVFQRPALLPTHTIRQNLAAGARHQTDVTAIAATLGLEAELNRYPHQLS